MNKKVILIGGGGHAKVLMEILNRLGVGVNFLVAPEVDHTSLLFSDIEKLQDDEDILKFKKNEVILINGIGSLPGNFSRKKIFEKFRSTGYQFLTVISDQAIVSSHINLSQGVQVMPGVIINADVAIGENTIINSGAILEHDCQIGANNHIAPGAVLSGGVTTGHAVHIGTGAKIIQAIQIGEFSVVGAGVSLTRNLGSNKVIHVAKPYLAKDFK